MTQGGVDGPQTTGGVKVNLKDSKSMKLKYIIWEKFSLVSHLVGNLLVLGLAGKKVEEVDDDSNDHSDLHVVVFPVGPELEFITICFRRPRKICQSKSSLKDVKVCQARCIKIS